MTGSDAPGSPEGDRKANPGAGELPHSVVQALFDSNPLPMWIYALDSLRFLAVNRSAVEHYGYTAADFLSMTIADIRPPVDVPALLANVERVGEGLNRAGIWRHLRQDGSLIFVEITSHPIEFHGQRAELVIAYDVSARVAAEEDLHHLLRLEAVIAEMSRTMADCGDLDRSIDQALEIIGTFSQADRAYLFQFDDDGRQMSNTHEWCADGVPPQKALLQGLSTEDFHWSMSRIRAGEILSVSDVRRLPAAARNEREILERQDIRSMIMVPVHRAGQVAGFLGFDNVVAAASWDAAAQRLLAIAAEIIGAALQRRADREALRFSAQQLDSIMRSAEHFVFYRLAVDQNAEHWAQVEFASDSLRDIVGVEPDAPFTTWFAHVHPDDLPTLEKENARAAAEGITLDQTIRMFHPQREQWRWIRAVSNPVRDASGEISH